MFYSIPVSNEQIITTTPIGAKSITHVFFESKNDGAFNYKRNADAVTITIDGKMICRDVPILPFMSSTTYGVNRHKWQDVALEVGLNVNLSEIKISAQTINDFNVVFVCSNNGITNTKGFDFVECKRFKLKEEKTIKEQKIAIFDFLAQYMTGQSVHAWGKDYNIAERERIFVKVVETATEPQSIDEILTESEYEFTYIDSTFTRPASADSYTFESSQKSDGTYSNRLYYLLGSSELDNVCAMESGDGMISVLKDPYTHEIAQMQSMAEFVFDYTQYAIIRDERYIYVTYDNGDRHGWIEPTSLKRLNKMLLYKYFNYVQSNNMQFSLIADWGVEQTISLDRPPLQMFFCQYKSESEAIEYYKNNILYESINERVLQQMDVQLNFDLSGTDSQEFDAHTDMALFMATDNVAWRKCVHTFSQVMPKGIGFTYNYNYNNAQINAGTMRMFYSKGYMPKTWDLYVFFIYKKLL